MGAGGLSSMHLSQEEETEEDKEWRKVEKKGDSSSLDETEGMTCCY